MKAIVIRSLTVSLAVAAAIALPTAVKAQAGNLSETNGAIATLSGELQTETSWCYRVPGYGWRCG